MKKQASQVSREVLKLVCFTLGRERFALEAAYAREIIRCGELMPVPGTPDFFLGVMILRGEVLATIHVGKFLGLSQVETHDPSRVLVLGRTSNDLGLCVDSVPELLELSVDDMSDRIERCAEMTRKYLRGVANEEVFVLDAAAMLDDAAPAG
jgi:purine-binding chemotaxis protein CheW